MSKLVLMAAPAGDASTRLELITLEHPKSTHLTKYLLSKGGARLFEVQESTPKVPASFFIDNSVKKDPTVHMITAVDPLFLALPLLEKSSAKFSPLDQILMSENAPQTVQLRGCKNLLLDKVCDVNDSFGPEIMLYRLNREKTNAWLKQKYQRVEKALGVRLLKQKEQSCNVAGFETVEEVKIEGTGTLDSAQQEQVSTDAIALVCEYLSDSTAKSFISTLGTDQSELAKKQAAAPKRSKWADTESSVDEHKRYLMKSKEQEEMIAKKKQKVVAKDNMTIQQKRLAKTNTKGMSSMMSFFKKK